MPQLDENLAFLIEAVRREERARLLKAIGEYWTWRGMGTWPQWEFEKFCKEKGIEL